MTLQIVGAGFGRTGTLSLKTALEKLGFDRCYHMLEVPKHEGHAAVWTRAAGGESAEWERLFAGYAATVDWPAAAFWREILASCDSARVILTVRDSAAWYESFASTILAKLQGPPPRAGPVRVIYDVSREVILNRTFRGRANEHAYAVGVYEEHNREVIASVKPHRLLVYDLSSGWEPLCRFLERPRPNSPFPHRNRRSSFESLFGRKEPSRLRLIDPGTRGRGDQADGG